MVLKNPLVHYATTNIAGEYQLADIWTGGSRTKGAVFFQINSNGIGGYYRRVDEDGLTNERYLTNLNTCMGLPNAFSFSFLEAGSAGFSDDLMVYMFFSSNVIMELVMDVSSNFISYGAGARKR